MAKINNKKIDVKFMVEDIVGCKWSLSVLEILDRGINRPGAIAREIDGLSSKVLNERLRKFLRYNIVSKVEYNEIPPKVEYKFTKFGLRFLKVLNEIRILERDFH